ncbi:hypothetical protein BJK05_06500 [Pectobacterium polaris]|uniref:hypothetical protein n=1 Tax=Pectobacterium polaris TaxID=2042057 RepID=UPI000AD1B5AE|nr:hypothetical protein [Pectobacterium polaris]ASY77454.1 hypothetical protein BJJ97_16765 [Pectobacterium polaris]ASY79665.1 hypothetical protein BJK05_06500 [Pectobacterium polaris]MCA6941963.1 hypothetical protein [Pectobacterium polaris]MCA6956144.1 hypothetical protein [Pectobacterium polaris]
MNTLNINWKPEFGTIFTWFAMDKHGKIAVMVNNCFGDLPKALLSINDAESLLDQLNEFLWEESEQFNVYPENKCGQTVSDLYSGLRFSHMASREEFDQWLKERSGYEQKIGEYNVPSVKGFFVYHGIEGSFEGEDYLVGYEGNTKMGDYFRFLTPTVYGSIADFPSELHHGIAVSDVVDFTTDRLFDNAKINDYFPRMYSE